jgi:hypothetical protein
MDCGIITDSLVSTVVVLEGGSLLFQTSSGLIELVHYTVA